jgi:hypothetical protein
LPQAGEASIIRACRPLPIKSPAMTEQERLELDAAAFRQLVQHLRSRPDVQNIELMNLAGFCRNCLSKWFKAAADDLSIDVSVEQAREEIYGMPYSEWKNKYQKEASAEQQATFANTTIARWARCATAPVQPDFLAFRRHYQYSPGSQQRQRG